MKKSMQIIDGFHPFAEEVRRCALDQDGSSAVTFDGHDYEGWAIYKHPMFLAQMNAALSRAVGGRTKIVGQSFVNASEGQLTTQWIHADNNCATHAAVLYLDKNEHGGTAFWRHQESGLDVFDQAFIAKFPNLNTEQIAAKLRADGCDESFWELAGYCGSRFNRLVWYSSQAFHSRYPREGFGSGDDARLTWVCFFNIE